MFQIPTGYTLRNAQFSLDFPDPACSSTNTPPRPISVIVETGSTVLDVMIAAADKSRPTMVILGSLLKPSTGQQTVIHATGSLIMSFLSCQCKGHSLECPM